MNTVIVRAVGLCAPGLDSWEAGKAVIAGDRCYADAPSPGLSSDSLPGTERRRANATSRLALAAAVDATAVAESATVCKVATVFASADGDGEVLAAILRGLSQTPILLSPTTFHNSVFNAPSGYWSLAARATAPSTTVCAGDATFAAGLIEAVTQVLHGASVLLVAYDHVFPESLPVRTRTRAAFACALLLEPTPATPTSGERYVLSGWRVESGVGETSPRALERFQGNAAACALPLLAAIAKRRPGRIALPYGENRRVVLEAMCA